MPWESPLSGLAMPTAPTQPHAQPLAPLQSHLFHRSWGTAHPRSRVFGPLPLPPRALGLVRSTFESRWEGSGWGGFPTVLQKAVNCTLT